MNFLEKAEIQLRVAEVIEASFDTRPMPSGNITRREVNRRVAKAKHICVTLAHEHGWTAQRIIDHLPAFLARNLDGEEAIPNWVKLEKDGCSSWGVEAAGRVKSERRLSALAKVGVNDGRKFDPKNE